ncbi:hypothetical protein D3C71_1939450 [compost metagenome]
MYLGFVKYPRTEAAPATPPLSSWWGIRNSLSPAATSRAENTVTAASRTVRDRFTAVVDMVDVRVGMKAILSVYG